MYPIFILNVSLKISSVLVSCLTSILVLRAQRVIEPNLGEDTLKVQAIFEKVEGC